MVQTLAIVAHCRKSVMKLDSTFLCLVRIQAEKVTDILEKLINNTTMNRISSIIVDNLFDNWKTSKEPPQEGEVILLYDPVFHTLRCAKYDNQVLVAGQRWINLMVFQTSIVDVNLEVCLI